MKRSVFYSWQSDLDSSENRSMIEEALKRALKSIQKDETETVDPVMDRDTYGIAGSPSISESIFAKITLADVFVADVSIINKTNTGRLTPNPNVLIELGYAVAQLGWERILLVQNTAYGTPEDLPFDLRGRRVVTYVFKRDESNRSEARALLQGRLEAGLKSALSESTQMSLPAGLNAPLWWGKWRVENDGNAFGGELFIREVSAAGFLFDLSVFNGAHMGSLTAYARLVAQDLAYARVINGNEGEIGEILFRREIIQGRRFIHIEETSSCHYYRGMGAAFAGDFIRIRDSLFDAGILNELDLKRLYSISGEHYESLRQRFQGLSETENLDTFPACATIGGVRGLYTIMEGILLLGPKGELWVAYIDDEVVRYFTTQSEWKNTLPKTIENWCERFKEKVVMFQQSVDIIPKEGY